MRLISETKYRLTSPCVDPETGAIFAVCSVSGTVLVLNTPNTDSNDTLLSFQSVAEMTGQPTSLAIDTHSSDTDTTSVSLLVADPTAQCVLPFDLPKSSFSDLSNDGTVGELAILSVGTSLDSIRTFEGRPFLGPRCVAVDCDGEIIFTDSGMPGDSSLTNPRGSVYRTINRRQQLTKLINSSLAMPTGVASTKKGRVIYIAEMATNRVLRLVKQPEGYYYYGVFLQLSGSMGPVAIAVHPTTGDIYVAQYDIKGVVDNGSIHVFYPSGELKGTIVVPSPQISGIAFDNSNTQLYITTEDSGGEPSRLYSTSLENGEEV